ncbi:MAG: DUF2059 domain-containing protein [Sphingomonadales bacterium]|nr:MAG: DUF2059 domain-containing protein [Sphingomonadales bacterium]
MTVRISLLIAGLLAATGAQAADKPAEKPAAAQPAAAQTPPQLDAETAKALEAVVAATGAADILQANLKRVAPFLVEPLVKANPGKEDALKAAVDKALGQSIDSSREIFLAGVRTAYVRALTPDELKAAAAFAATPAGKKLIGAQAVINRDISITGQQITKRVADDTLKALKTEAEKSGFTIPKELTE